MMKRRKAPGEPIADLVNKAIAPCVRSHGFGTAELIARWDTLVGERFARVSRPLRVLWPRQSAEVVDEAERAPATLVVACESAHALDLQFAAPLILERVSIIYGWRAIERLTIRQQPVVKRIKRALPAELPPAPAPLAGVVETVTDPDLRRALDRLGRSIAAGKSAV